MAAADAPEPTDADRVPADVGHHPSTDELLAHNEDHVANFADTDMAAAPRRHLAVVTCMDARMDLSRILGLGHGDAHVLRNGGGVVTDDVVRSLCLSQRYLGTREIVLVHHTDCGLQKVDETELRDELEAEVGVKPSWAVESFADPHADVRQSMQRLLGNPFLAHKDHIRGFVYDVATGELHEVVADST